MKSCFLAVLILFSGMFTAIAQSPSREWTEWQSVQGGWAELYTFVSFRGITNSKEAVSTVPLKKLKVENYIVGRFLPPFPPGVDGVKTFRILYTEFGKYETFEGFRVDFAE